MLLIKRHIFIISKLLLYDDFTGKDAPNKETPIINITKYFSVSPVYVGDDVTDEDAMLALKGLGFSFKVIK